MLVYKCDSCGKTIENHRSGIHIEYGWKLVALCPACGWEIVDFLQEKKLIKLEGMTL